MKLKIFWANEVLKNFSEKLNVINEVINLKITKQRQTWINEVKTRLKISNPYLHDVLIYLPNFKPNRVNRVRGEV